MADTITTFEFMNTREGFDEYNRYSNNHLETVSLTISAKNQVMPCFAEEGTYFDSFEEAKTFADEIKNCNGWNYETDQAIKEQNKLITEKTLIIKVATFSLDEEGELDKLIEENLYSLDEFIELEN